MYVSGALQSSDGVYIIHWNVPLHIVFLLICVQVWIRCSLIIRWCLYYSLECIVWLWCWVFDNAFESDDFGQVGGFEEGYWGGEWMRNLGQWLL